MGRLSITYSGSAYRLVVENMERLRGELAEAADDVFTMVDGDSGRLQRLGERYGLLKELEECFRRNGWDRESEAAGEASMSPKRRR